MQDKKARKANIQIFGSKTEIDKTSGEYAKYNHKYLPTSHTDFKRVEAHLCKELEEQEKENGKEAVPGISNIRLNIFRKAYEFATRDPVKNVDRVRCPNCGKITLLNCQHCGNEVEVVVPDAQLEKNTISVLVKYMDKFAPNMAAVTSDPNLTNLLTKVQEFVSMVITKYVPSIEKDGVIKQWKNKMNQVVEAEFEVVNEK